MKILIVTGMPGAGKEEFLSVAGSKGISFVRMGDVVREAYAATKKDDVSIGQFADSERKDHGKNIWAKRTIDRMQGAIFLVDGCRSMDEVRSFRELSNDVRIVGIHTPPEQRYERLIKRGRDDAPANVNEFNERDSREISWGIAEVIALSDVMLVNDSSLQNFHSAANRVLEDLR